MNGNNQPMNDCREALKDHPFLKGITPAHIDVLAKYAMPVGFEPGQVIFKAGDPANRFYLISQGSVALRANTAQEVQRITAGDVLGWSWLFEPYQWQFDAVTLEHTSANFLYGTRLRELCETDPDFGYELMKRCSRVAIQRLEYTLQRL